ncbi:alginate export family protein [Novosphingobium sp. ZN18A2]|uniref:alginate export family protein n=1 Tax=Novosphingobium sp. ZN18A2 TaxID=3079861 RepID=UPI0030D2E9EB
MRHTVFTLAAVSTIAIAAPAHAKAGDPVAIGGGFSLDPMLNARLRYEAVDQPATDADAVTLRLRSGFELKHAPSHLSALAEAEATLGIVNDYNAFPFAIADSQRRTGYSVVADPMNVELNRLQIQYKTRAVALTVGRQRINLDDQRWVGSVGWRQNEQTFDAVRGEVNFGPVSLDGTYSISQRTIFGTDAGPRMAYGGDFVFLGAGVKAGPVQVKGFAYLLDYDEAFFYASSTQTYGLRATTALPLGKGIKLSLAGSYARQSNYGTNPFTYSADYIAADAGLAFGSVALTGGYEKLGADNGRAVQSPMATLHKFNGWADVFLTTPQTPSYAGLQDYHGGLSWKAPKSLKALPGLNAAVIWHSFDSDTGSVPYGTEWDASVGFRLGPVGLLAKYANYNARDFGADTKKFWLQAEIAY